MVIGERPVSNPSATATSQLFRRKYRRVKVRSGINRILSGTKPDWPTYGSMPEIAKNTDAEVQIAIAGAAVLKSILCMDRPGFIQKRMIRHSSRTVTAPA